MPNIKKIQKKLSKEYGDKVQVTFENDIIRLTGELDNWDDVFAACSMAATKNSKIHVVNDIKFTGDKIPPMRVPSLVDTTLEGKTPDVLVIGGGISGCAIARELSKWNIDVMLIEKNADFAMGASGANDGEVHVGFDLSKGSLKQKYVLLGNHMYDKLCSDLSVPFRREGQYALFTQSWLFLPVLFFCIWRKYHDGVTDTHFLTRRKILKAEPTFDRRIRFGVYNHSAGVVCPYGLTIAYAENAVENGAEAYLNTAVLSIDTDDNGVITAVNTNRGTIKPKIVVNAAGVFADDIAEMANDRFYSIHPRRGTNSIQDRKSAKIIDTIASVQHIDLKQQSKSHTKGGGLMRTVHDNILAGPDAVECYAKEDTATHPESIKVTYDKQKGTVPLASERDIITYFTGVRAPTFEEDFVIEWGRNCGNLFHCGGIQSPGLTAAPAFALDIEMMIVERLSKMMTVEKKTKWQPKRQAVPVLKDMSPAKRAALIAKNPDYGVIICRCEEISKGEIIDALNRPLCPPTVDAIKKRIRPGMGRCQGGFCSPLVTKIIAEHEHCTLSDVKKSSAEAVICYGETKGGDTE
ncbi:MAG: NAD(P)/FAD-dependent oxidoreductase [Oscillospiraceae bacterium]|nr:NAD(P)/FAD-dependent oxidoreductase [Candidatus Limimonas coprohippi]